MSVKNEIMSDKIFETASFHIVKPCNMRCKFCYATFDDMAINKQLPLNDAKNILLKLKEAGVKKITFAGGEPLLYRNLLEAINYASGIGLTTSIITNGYLLDTGILKKMEKHLDWIGISVDSLNKETNEKIGRVSKHRIGYRRLVGLVKSFGFKLKINTVVNAYNWTEDMNAFISESNPERWKVFQALRVDGQNDKQFEEIKVDETQYYGFIERHKYQPSMVAENNEAMTGSYLLIDPQGRLFENSKGRHTYSSPLQDNDIDKCLSEINLNREMFLKRGGIYEW